MENRLRTIDLAVVIEHQPKPDEKAHYLNKEQATELLHTIGQNIAQYFPQIREYGLIGIGSIYHLHQIIRPNFPIYTQLFEISKIRFRANNFKPLVIGIGTSSDQFEIPIFNKELNQFADPLEVLPFTVVMPDNAEAEDFITQLENELITKAHLNQEAVDQFEAAFNQNINNISIVTLADLNGLFASQLIQIGLEELWQVIQAVIFDQTETLRTLGSGHTLYWKLDEVALYVAHPSIYDVAMKDYLQDYQTYALTTQRLEHLFKMHQIPYAKIEVMDPKFFEGNIDIERARGQLNQHIKAL
ncbi:hypothetical protein DC083_06770 [Ignatzschineria ureiclastica]|uniref:Uncharacterized protein n=1 Tax=Ignatzschineria ureiclastica TaxID=472582 RepID=A0A2U2ADW0_9GAMM|nr:hypothetical protein [Ignatzschineria ureiclastica]PWD80807.1 hypothetical protein DC083_06770 [Ignatzschineria ureiclastica]GGZ94566.1 hypothetical protein GCM10007162_07980 [Ignatzschineria ureiclastica]